MRYEDIIARIRQQKDISIEELEARIKEKLARLSDLISKEGAAHIVANELGVKLFDDLRSRKLKINNLLGGMRSVTIAGKITQMFGVNHYNKNGREGKVANMFMADETGMVRVVFWDSNHIKLIEDNQIKEGDIIRIRNGYIRVNNGFNEIHAGSYAQVFVNPPDEKIENVAESQHFSFEDKKISELKDNDDNVAISGTIVQAFEPRFYTACPECGKKVLAEGESFKCGEHGIVNAEHVPILNVFFDDGTDSIRVTAFRNQAERILGLSREEVLTFKDNPAAFETAKENLLGKQLKIVGRVKNNEIAGRNEFTSRLVLDVNPKELAGHIADELKA